LNSYDLVSQIGPHGVSTRDEVELFESGGGILGPSESIKGRTAVQMENDFSRVKRNNKERLFSLTYTHTHSQL